MDTPTISESRDGSGAGDHDVAFAWDTPRSYLTTIAQARLTILRGLVMDERHGEHGGPAEGDLGWTEETPTGLIVPLATTTAVEPAASEPELPEDLYLG